MCILFPSTYLFILVSCSLNICYCFLQLTYLLLFPAAYESKNEGTSVDGDLYSLTCRPDRLVRSYSACIINGV
jgi:hypothetical protein